MISFVFSAKIVYYPQNNRFFARNTVFFLTFFIFRKSSGNLYSATEAGRNLQHEVQARAGQA